ncbi:hypothetical protein POTOM_007992 [Populus tomentosa]|uniref:Uncharacterized protein n=1 Tax=Populus tomentosa TaxID=118781 RepID=A0A8X8AGN5_POPTO|nr:hypothetical protein POTOM_007992 [Populus tomentosa]
MVMLDDILEPCISVEISPSSISISFFVGKFLKFMKLEKGCSCLLCFKFYLHATIYWKDVSVGTLRDHSKKALEHSVAPIDLGETEANESDSVPAIDTHNNPVTYANGGDTALITDH